MASHPNCAPCGRARLAPNAASSWAVWLPALLVVTASCAPNRAPGDQRTAERLPTPSRELRHLFLITADTWRADHFLTRRAGRELTPTLSALAKTGVVFTDNTSVASITSPGVAGILTGLMPLRSGVLRNEHMLPASAPSLPQTLQAAGFFTAAFVANPVLKPGMGFERGFDTYELLPVEAPRRKARAESVTARALAWLGERDPDSERVFLWVHFLEPHGPLEPSEEAMRGFPLTAFGSQEQRVPLLPTGDPSGKGGIPGYQWDSELFPGQQDVRDYQSRYAAEVWSFDRALGEFLAALEQRGWTGAKGRSLLVLASDHGEALANDHGFYFSHAHPPTQDQIQTPLMFVYPGAGGTRIDEPVSNLDIAPTAASLLGVDGALPCDGSDLLASIETKPIVAQYARYRMTRLGSHKWVRMPNGSQMTSDLSTDPQELGKAELPADIRAKLSREFDRQSRVLPVAPSVSRFELNDEERAQLEALGYVE